MTLLQFAAANQDVEGCNCILRGFAVTPEQIAKSGSEHAHQAALFCWARQNVSACPPLALMFAIPNGGLRDRITAGKLKAEGVKAGVPDIFLPVPIASYHGLFIEIKKPGGKLSDVQKETIFELEKMGYRCCVCYSWIDATLAIVNYLEGKQLHDEQNFGKTA